MTINPINDEFSLNMALAGNGEQILDCINWSKTEEGTDFWSKEYHSVELRMSPTAFYHLLKIKKKYSITPLQSPK
jgi:hypothetical protein